MKSQPPHRPGRRLGRKADAGQTTGTVFWFPVGRLACRFDLRFVSVLAWLAAVVRILGVALQRTTRAAADVYHHVRDLLADRAAAHYQ